MVERKNNMENKMDLVMGAAARDVCVNNVHQALGDDLVLRNDDGTKVENSDGQVELNRAVQAAHKIRQDTYAWWDYYNPLPSKTGRIGVYGAVPSQVWVNNRSGNDTAEVERSKAAAEKVYLPAKPKSSWDLVAASVRNGTYHEVFREMYENQGSLPLDLGKEGVIDMQIAAFDADDLADGSGKAPITWISKQLLKTNRRMNPPLVTNYDESTKPAWAQDSSGIWSSQNQKGSSTSAAAKWTVTATEAGTVTVSYKVSSENRYDKLTVVVNGETVADAISGAGDWIDYTVNCSAGDEVTVNATYSKDSSGDGNADTGYVKFSSTGAYTVTPEIGNVNIKTVRDYVEGTGSIGGWENSEMRTYLNETVKPLIPDTVRAAIKPVTKTHPAYDVDESSFTQTTTDSVWIPSYSEMFNGIYKSLFPDKSSRLKKKAGASSASWWWLRSANYAYNFDTVNSDGSNNGSNANISFGVALGFCT